MLMGAMRYSRRLFNGKDLRPLPRHLLRVLLAAMGAALAKQCHALPGALAACATRNEIIDNLERISKARVPPQRQANWTGLQTRSTSPPGP